MSMRVGCGFDVHPFGPGDSLVLGGVRVPYSRGIVAHSDGDVLMHALVDALLGAAGLGDIGQHFPDSDPQWRGVESKRFVAQTCQMLERRHFKLINADLTLLAQSPKIAAWRDQMRYTIAAALQVSEACVNIKATTTEHLGFVGRNEGLAAMAVVLLEGDA